MLESLASVMVLMCNWRDEKKRGEFISRGQLLDVKKNVTMEQASLIKSINLLAATR